MSNNTLVDKIRADGESAVAEVRAKQEQTCRDIESETTARSAELAKEHEKQLAKKIAHTELVAVSRAKQAANIAIQAAKRKELDEVFDTAQAAVAALVGKEYVEFFLTQAKKVLPEECGVVVEVIAPSTKESETTDLLKALKVNAPLVTDASVDAGLIIRTEDGVYDITLTRLFADHRPDMEIEVMKILRS